ncbi:competence/damage-inducible protein A [Fructilactobacillus myrtifloralis]|uniref:Putative competence-damage inducible protein n=1 Tax=Fructilactobacillus myrtifloralis TaxID=2940301 RepID=A0ABY5BNK5_9LACO|nr:competence/damage-inducible protein A [Fructilactobacillus myrtifloralis]USS85172.1 competence/damage-inducible protein A [Fructilactobacillus myrtifloralis]
MKAEIISVGTELLLGEIVDTSTPFIAQHLADLGIDVYYEATVGDNRKRLTEAIRQAEQRSDLVVLTGGLGPTEDDITKTLLAELVDRQLVTDEPAQAKLDEFYTATGKPKPTHADLMSQFIAGADVLPNQVGFAVGMLLTTANCIYLVLPGPPAELQPMFEKEAEPRLAQLVTGKPVISSRVLRFFGIGEPALEDQLRSLITTQTNPTLATYAKRNEVTLRITASGEDADEVAHKLQTTIDAVLARVGTYFYGYGDDNSLEQVVVGLLRKHQLTITAAESLTGGLFQSTLANVPGVSAVFAGGFVTYSATTKEQLVQVPAATIATNGVVSKETATAMAQGAQRQLHTDLAVAFTGVAGPGAADGHPAGDFWVALALPNGTVQTKQVLFARDRNLVRDYAVKTGLKMIYDQLAR